MQSGNDITTPTGDVKYLVTQRFGVVSLIRNQRTSFFEDAHGTVFALIDKSETKDLADRCGVAPFALPEWDMFELVNAACVPHDYMYSCPVYQAFHNRSEADEELARLQATVYHPVLGELFSSISQKYGAEYWENQQTRHK